MQFVFNGTLDELKDAIKTTAHTLHKDIIVLHDVPTVLQIGFQRLGHSGGRFFVADILEEANCVILTGETQDIFPHEPTKQLYRVLNLIETFLFEYLIFAFIPFIVWFFIHEYISIWYPILLPFPLMILAQLKSQKTNGDTDAAFYQFMVMVTSREITIPANSQELYDMLINTPGLHSVPQIKENVITWELYNDVYIETYIDECDTIINVVRKNMLYGSLMHWHPELEDMYEELLALGKKGNVLVLRKCLNGAEVYYVGEADKYHFPSKKKWHWGNLIYLNQR